MPCIVSEAEPACHRPARPTFRPGCCPFHSFLLSCPSYAGVIRAPDPWRFLSKDKLDMPVPTPSEIVNPLTAGSPHSLLPQPCVLVIFGAAGDLSWRKLLPALYNLNVDGVLPSNFAIVGFRIGAEGDPDEWIRQRAKDGTVRFSRRPPEDSHWADFARSLFYVNGSFNDARAYAQLKARLESIDQQFGIPCSR